MSTQIRLGWNSNQTSIDMINISVAEVSYNEAASETNQHCWLLLSFLESMQLLTTVST